MCTHSGRISWTRSIESKLAEVVSLLQNQNYFNDTKSTTVQPTIKLYNALSKDLLLYEVQQFKAWFDTVHFIFDLLSQPIIRRNSPTNRLEVNFDMKILNAIEESKKMIKLGLGETNTVSLVIQFAMIDVHNISTDIPQLGQALVNYEDDLKCKLSAINKLIEWNNQLRLSIPIIFLNICRPQLRKIDKAFEAGLSQIQWLSKDFNAYIEKVQQVFFLDFKLKSWCDFKSTLFNGFRPEYLGFSRCRLCSKTSQRSKSVSH